KDSSGDGFKPSREEEKKNVGDPGNEDNEVLSTKEPRVNQEKDSNVNSINNINTLSPTANAVGIKDNAVDKNIVYGCANDPNMPNLEEIVYSDDDEDFGAEADMTNLDTNIPISPITTRIHKDHPVEQIIRDIHSTPQTRMMTKSVTDHEPKKQVWTLVDLPNGNRAIGTKWINRNKKDEKGIMVRNKARLVTQSYTQEEEIYYVEVFAPVDRIEAIRLFLAYASFKDFIVYHMDVKSAFLYGKIEEEVYVCQPLGFEDPEFPTDFIRKEMCTEFEKMMHKKFQMSFIGELLFFLGLTPMETSKPLIKDENTEDVDVHLYRSMIGSLMYLTSSRPDIMFAVCGCARFQVTPNISHLHAVKRIFRYLKGQPKLGLWYPKDTPFNLEAYTNSDYAGASLDRKSTTGGCQFFRSRLISWQCKKQIVVANFNTKAEYVAASNCCGQAYTYYCQLKVNAASYKLTTVIDVNVVEGWATAMAKNINREAQIHAKVDGKKVIISKETIRKDLKFEDEGRVDCLSNEVIFEQLPLMGYENLSLKLTFYKEFFSQQWKFLIHIILQCLSAKTTAWNKFSSTMASAIIFLATNQNFNFSKYIFDSMVKHLDSGTKFLMFPRFVQVFLDKQVDGTSKHNAIFVIPFHIKKVFRNMKMRKYKHMKTRRKDIELPQTSVPTKVFGDEDVYEDMYDSMERATTTATGLDGEQDMGSGISAEEQSLDEEDASKQGRNIADIDADVETTLVDETTEDQGRSRTKEKKKMVEPEMPLKKKAQISLDEELAFKLQAEQEEERIAREKALKANITEWDDVQALMDTDYELAARLQEEEQRELTIEEKSRLFVELMYKRKKHFTKLTAKKKRRKPPTKAQKRNQICVYLKNMAGFTHSQLKNKSFDEVQKAFDKTMSWICT
nr:hypothetical protein [Tanacetum cinerariifolium]